MFVEQPQLHGSVKYSIVQYFAGKYTWIVTKQSLDKNQQSAQISKLPNLLIDSVSSIDINKMSPPPKKKLNKMHIEVA